MTTTEITLDLKLMIDSKTNKLVFAEASKDFVDFIFFLLSLPIGTAIKLLTSQSMAGSIGNVYSSFSNLDQTYLQPNIKKDLLLNPMVFSSPSNIPLSIARSSIIYSGKFYTCSNSKCKKYIITNICTDLCGSCYHQIKEINVAGGNGIFNMVDKETKGYVKEKVSYMILDDLSVMPISTMSIISTMDKLNVSKLEERKVKVGAKEAMELLKMSFQSTTVLTDVFLKK